MRLCPTHGVELVRSTVTDSRGKVTTFLRCPAIIKAKYLIFEDEELLLDGPPSQCNFMRPLKQYSETGSRKRARKTNR